MPAPRILVVDDDPDIRAIVAGFVRAAGCTAHAARDGEDGWVALTREPFDLVVTDYQMPRLTGMELVRRLHLAGMTTPVIMVSGVAPPGATDHSSAPIEWFNAFLPKPFTAAQLVGTVRLILSKGERLPQTPRGIAIPFSARDARSGFTTGPIRQTSHTEASRLM